MFPDEDSSSNDVGQFGLQLKAIEDELEPTSSSSGEERLMAMIDDDSDYDDDDDGSMISNDETLCGEDDEEHVEKKRVHRSEKSSKKTYEVICPELTMRGMFGGDGSTGEGRTQKHASKEQSLGNYDFWVNIFITLT